MALTIEQMAALCQSINDNYRNDSARYMWRNLKLVPEAVAELRRMPLEGDTSAKNQIEVIELMLECVDECSIPRHALDIRRYQLSLYALLAADESPEPDRTEVENAIRKLEDYIDLSIPMDEWCRRYHRHLRFDPVERTPEWEQSIYEAEQEADRRLGNTPRGMGFCFDYWSTFRAVMAEKGIQWRSPSSMNPGVMFD